MKKLTKEFTNKKPGELEKEAQNLRQELTKLQLEHKVNVPKDTNSLIKKKKRLAVLLTVMSQKKLAESNV